MIESLNSGLDIKKDIKKPAEIQRVHFFVQIN
jgi:hypothetical protein